MARSRILDPGFFTNEDLLELPLEARVLFAGLWCLADRKGRLEDRPKRIKIELFPGDNYDVDSLLQALLSKGFIHRYAVPGANLIHVRHFLKYQRCHPREAQSVWPECPCETEKECLGDAEDLPRTDLGTAKVSGLGSPKTKGSPVSPEVSSEEGAGAPVSRKPIDELFLQELQDEHPTVNVRQVYERAQNRKTWDGYKDKRRALRDHVGYALQDQRKGNSNGRTGNHAAGTRVSEKFAAYG